ncbi:hypothetical protein LTR37_006350 [Vermiconidia calcicola]|uniref:Uncharacterized protein n=1 Tax=Vermiconidia calcicola TaxID=1690605 RepID=A0ACC3NHK4_9PEZI|nr:hypothetical protein LTR37_006350 [Vermiconidia calcicola]
MTSIAEEKTARKKNKIRTDSEGVPTYMNPIEVLAKFTAMIRASPEFHQHVPVHVDTFTKKVKCASHGYKISVVAIGAFANQPPAALLHKIEKAMESKDPISDQAVPIEDMITSMFPDTTVANRSEGTRDPEHGRGDGGEEDVDRGPDSDRIDDRDRIHFGEDRKVNSKVIQMLQSAVKELLNKNAVSTEEVDAVSEKFNSLIETEMENLETAAIAMQSFVKDIDADIGIIGSEIQSGASIMNYKDDVYQKMRIDKSRNNNMSKVTTSTPIRNIPPSLSLRTFDTAKMTRNVHDHADRGYVQVPIQSRSVMSTTSVKSCVDGPIDDSIDIFDELDMEDVGENIDAVEIEDRDENRTVRGLAAISNLIFTYREEVSRSNVLPIHGHVDGSRYAARIVIAIVDSASLTRS